MPGLCDIQNLIQMMNVTFDLYYSIGGEYITEIMGLQKCAHPHDWGCGCSHNYSHNQIQTLANHFKLNSDIFVGFFRHLPLFSDLISSSIKLWFGWK